MAQQLGSANAQAGLVAAARKRAIAMFEKNLNKDSKELLLQSFEGWCDVWKTAKRVAARKEQVYQRVMRNLGNEAQVLVALGFSMWRKIAAEDRELAQER